MVIIATASLLAIIIGPTTWFATRDQGVVIGSSRGIGSAFLAPHTDDVLDYAGSYVFLIRPAEGADSYLWEFRQNGTVVWQNRRDEGRLSANSYAITAGSFAHSKFIPGYLEVLVKARVAGTLGDASTILITLR